MLDSDYYLFGVNKSDSFFLSLMYIVSKEFKLKNSKIQNNYIETLKETIKPYYRILYVYLVVIILF